MSRTLYAGRPIVRGAARGPALSTDVPVNFTAAFTKIPNLLPWRRAEVRDRHHPWFKTNIKDCVLVLPACIGSTHTGLVLLDLVRMHNGPAAIIVDAADSLLVSGVLLSEVWYGTSMPVIEADTTQIRAKLRDGQMIAVDQDGTITVENT